MNRLSLFVLGSIVVVFAKFCGIPIPNEFLEKIADLKHFGTFGLGVLLVSGFLLVAATPKALFFKELLRKLNSKVSAKFCAVAGGVAGWAISVSGMHIYQDGASVILESIQVTVGALLLTTAPVFLHAFAQEQFETYGCQTNKNRRHVWVLQLSGYLLIIYSAYALLSTLLKMYLLN